MSTAKNPATACEVKYQSFNNPESATIIMGIRGITNSEKVYVSGTIASGMTHGQLYAGYLNNEGKDGKWYTLNYTSTDFDDVTSTSCYGPNNGPDGTVQIVGAYLRSSTGNMNHGFYYEGNVNGEGKWITVLPNSGNVNNVFVHSIMGGLAVGNYDFGNDVNGCAFIYDVKTNTCTDFMLPDALTTTLYGIWHNGGDSYTLAGGYSADQFGEISQAFLVDYDIVSRTTGNLRSFSYNNETLLSVVTHFEGITASDDNGYNMPADWVNAKASPKEGASFVSVKRNADGTFGDAAWTDITYPGAMLTSANTVYKNNILGICVTGGEDSGTTTTSSYCATVI